MKIKVSDNKRFLVFEDGKPFFYLADTAWELFHRATRGDAERYLNHRAAHGYTVIQAVVLAEFNGLNDPTPYGQTPLQGNDPTKPNEEYFKHIDYIVNLASKLGLTMGMLPTWGDKWNKAWGAGPVIFNPQNARIYGKWLGNRYKDVPLIWILGGDRPIETAEQRATIEAMAAGLREGDGGNHLMTFHPVGGKTSSEYFHDADWLDFNMWQSGHDRNRANYNDIASDYERTPRKPVLDGEPGYEDHVASFNPDNGYLDDWDNRKSCYRALFAGACGHTYGCHPIWQFFSYDHEPVNNLRRTWVEALNLPGGRQMQYAKKLLLSRPYLTRIPDQSLLVSPMGEASHHVQATRDANGYYAFVYLPTAKSVEIATSSLAGQTLVAHWYDPRTGAARFIGTFPRTGHLTFTPPGVGPDWILILDDESKGYAF